MRGARLIVELAPSPHSISQPATSPMHFPAKAASDDASADVTSTGEAETVDATATTRPSTSRFGKSASTLQALARKKVTEDDIDELIGPADVPKGGKLIFGFDIAIIINQVLQRVPVSLPQRVIVERVANGTAEATQKIVDLLTVTYGKENVVFGAFIDGVDAVTKGRSTEVAKRQSRKFAWLKSAVSQTKHFRFNKPKSRRRAIKTMTRFDCKSYVFIYQLFLISPFPLLLVTEGMPTILRLLMPLRSASQQ